MQMDFPGVPYTFQTKGNGCHSCLGQSPCWDQGVWTSSYIDLSVLWNWLTSAAGSHCQRLLKAPPASPHSQKESLGILGHSVVLQTCSNKAQTRRKGLQLYNIPNRHQSPVCFHDRGQDVVRAQKNSPNFFHLCVPGTYNHLLEYLFISYFSLSQFMILTQSLSNQQWS